MAPQPGTSHSEAAAREGLVAAVWRPVGFVLLAGMALTILAAVALLPPYARLLRVRYEHDRLMAKNADDEALIAAYDRLIEAAPTDPVLTKRLAICEFGLLPRNEMIVHSSRLPRGRPPGLPTINRRPPPARPPAWILRTAASVGAPVARAALCLIASAALLAAILLTGPSKRKAMPPASSRFHSG